MIENYRRPDYEHYVFNLKETVRYILEGILLVAAVGYFFYRSFLITIMFSPLILFYLQIKKKSLCKKRKEELQIQFKDALKSVYGSLQAGYSMENAFLEGYRDMVEYHGSDSIIAKEFYGIKTGICNNMNVEELVEDIGKRSEVEDIQDFAGILKIGKQTGGNLPVLFENTMLVIEEKINVKQEILTLISAKRLESRIMSVIPFVIIFYVDTTSKGYFDVLYTGVAGKILMTVCLGVYIFAVWMSGKIIDIEI